MENATCNLTTDFRTIAISSENPKIRAIAFGPHTWISSREVALIAFRSFNMKNVSGSYTVLFVWFFIFHYIYLFIILIFFFFHFFHIYFLLLLLCVFCLFLFSVNFFKEKQIAIAYTGIGIQTGGLHYSIGYFKYKYKSQSSSSHSQVSQVFYLLTK